MLLEMINNRIDHSIVKRLFRSGYQDSRFQQDIFDQVFEKKKFNVGDNDIGLFPRPFD